MKVHRTIGLTLYFEIELDHDANYADVKNNLARWGQRKVEAVEGFEFAQADVVISG